MASWEEIKAAANVIGEVSAELRSMGIEPTASLDTQKVDDFFLYNVTITSSDSMTGETYTMRRSSVLGPEFAFQEAIQDFWLHIVGARRERKTGNNAG